MRSDAWQTSPTHTPLMIDVHSDLQSNLRGAPRFRSAPNITHRVYRDAAGKAARRLTLSDVETKISLERVVHVDDTLDDRDERATVLDPALLPENILPYLRASRYCDSDRLANLAWRKFGKLQKNTALVEAICTFTRE
jgi:hypothetical protein